MRRWNGWGDESVHAELPSTAVEALELAIGRGTPPRDATIDEVVAGAPRSRLEGSHPLVSTAADARLRHARGQSLPDWIALRSGRLGWWPDGIAHPATTADVAALIRLGVDAGIRLIPYGGGTSVAGHVTPTSREPPTITLALDRLSGLRTFDDRSGLATFGTGTLGPAVEAALAPLGRTLGHYPQSFEYSTIGGWVATRSSGQQALLYGRIEALFAGGHLESPAGPLDLLPFPASAAGPDLRQIVLGSEGRLGVLTDVVLRTAPRPARERFMAFFLPGFDAGLRAVRALADERVPLSMARLSTPAETGATLALAGRRPVLAVFLRYLGLRGIGEEGCLLIAAASGREGLVRMAIGEASSIVRREGGLRAPDGFGRAWQRQRFRSAYLRNALWDAGYAVDTLETALTWDRLPALVTTLDDALSHGLDPIDERVYAFSHVSHLYSSGGSVYATYAYRRTPDPDETLDRWATLKAVASNAIVAAGGTISHQHGIGRDHRAFLAREKTELGMAAIRQALRVFDPNGVMNRGALVDDEAVPVGAAGLTGATGTIEDISER